MSDEKTTEVETLDIEEVQDNPQSWWQEYVGQICTLQLRPGVTYIAITSDNNLYQSDSGPVQVPILQGQISQVIQESNGDTLLVLQMDSPDGRQVGPAQVQANGSLTIVLHSIDVGFATFPQRKLVQTV